MRYEKVSRLVGGLTLAWAMCSDPAALGAEDSCVYRGTNYSHGATACQEGKQYRCDDGEWRKQGTTCTDDSMARAKPCVMAGISYSAGSASCQNGTQYRCDDGAWSKLGTTCAVGDSPIRALPSGRTCMFDGATVATNSAICRSGTTFLCSDGEWVNIGTQCR